MEELDFKPNSHKFKKEQQESLDKQKKVEKVVTGTAKTKKKSEIRKFRDIFISEDAKNVKSYVFMDVLVPAIKKAISDIVTDGIDMILYGGSKRDKERSSGGSKISYRNFYDQRDDRRSVAAARPTNRFDFDDIVFDNRGDAEAVLKQMLDVIETYNMVTVADMYEFSGLTEPFTSNKYGWTNLRNAEVVRLRNGYYALELPKAMPID